MHVSFSTAHLAARIANMLEALDALMEFTEPNKPRDEALLEVIRATMDDANALASVLNKG